jgi:hypothetical protein
MAVGAEDTKVLEPIVERIPVDVVERQRKRLASPLDEAAVLTIRRLMPSLIIRSRSLRDVVWEPSTSSSSIGRVGRVRTDLLTTLVRARLVAPVQIGTATWKTIAVGGNHTCATRANESL